MPKPQLKRSKAQFFKPKEDQPHHDFEQNINVNVVVNEKPEEDAVSGCFKALFSCAKKAAK